MENLQLDDFTKYKFLSQVKFSKDGKNLAYVVSEIDKEENKYLANIHVYNIEDNKHLKLTSNDNERSFIFKDENTILFPSSRDPKDKERRESFEDFTTYYEIALDGGEANKAFEIPLNVVSISILDEDNFVVTGNFDNNKPDLSKLSEEDKKEAIKNLKEEKDYEVLDEIPFWLNGAGFTNKKRTRLYLYNKKDKEVQPITDEFTDVSSFKLDENKENLVFVSTSYFDKMPLKSDINIYNIKDKSLKKISHHEHFSYSYIDFLEDKIVFIGSDMAKLGINENNHIFTMDLDGSKVVQITKEDFDKSNWSSVGSDCRYGGGFNIKVDGKYLYFNTTERESSYLNRIDKEGNLERLIGNKGSVDSFDVLGGQVYFVGLRGLKLQEIYRLKDKEEIMISSYNQWVNKEKTLSDYEELLFTNKDGVEIQGWLMKPVGFNEDKTYPGILNIHGGPKTVYGEVFYHEMQYWTNQGYFVFFSNPRGSDGRGGDFSDIRGKYGTIDYDDLMEFTDRVLEKYPNIDKDRLGVTGGSYGGFMTNWIIGHTDRFKAAASQRSISNWISKFGTTDIGYYFVDDQNSATPWSDFEKLWFHSPMKYADRVSTPTLFIHSEEDYRCWLPEGIQMYTSLKFHGVESRLVMFRGENHELSRSGKPKHRIRRLKEITTWFDRYLK